MLGQQMCFCRTGNGPFHARGRLLLDLVLEVQKRSNDVGTQRFNDQGDFALRERLVLVF